MNPHPSLSFIRILGSERELDGLQQFFAGLAAPTRAFLGEPEARRSFTMLPPGKTANDKFFFGIHEGDALIGCFDVIRGYPDAACAFIGLLALAENRRGRGIGSACWKMAEAFVSSWPTIGKIRLGVAEGNRDAEAFWYAMGFSPTGEKLMSRSDHASVLCGMFEKPANPDATRICRESPKV